MYILALDRWVALVIMVIALAYGYEAYFGLDQLLPPFMQRNPIWPSTFPKLLSVIAVATSLVILIGFEKQADDTKDIKPDQIDYRRLFDYQIGRVALLVLLMIGYALLLRSAGFLLSTFSFLVIASVILGERRFVALLPIAGTATFGIWYLVEGVLGIFLRPLPLFLH